MTKSFISLRFRSGLGFLKQFKNFGTGLLRYGNFNISFIQIIVITSRFMLFLSSFFINYLIKVMNFVYVSYLISFSPQNNYFICSAGIIEPLFKSSSLQQYLQGSKKFLL